MTPILMLALLLGADADALEIEKKALDEREKIERGEVTFDVTRRYFEKSGEIQRSETSRYEVTFDGNNVRTIKNRQEWHVFTDRYHLWQFGSRDAVDPKPAYQYDLTTPEGRRDNFDSYRINLRLLGIMADDTQAFNAHKVSEFLTQPNRESVKLTKLKVEDRDVFRIEFERPDRPLKFTFLIDPEMNHSVIEALIKTPDSIQRIENKLKFYEDKYWFPETVHYTHSFNGKVAWESVVTVKQAVFNQPIDKNMFSFRGISLPVGTRVVVVPRSGPTRYWDGVKLVTEKELDPDAKSD